jgi:hypothetical protein
MIMGSTDVKTAQKDVHTVGLSVASGIPERRFSVNLAKKDSSMMPRAVNASKRPSMSEISHRVI